MAIKQFELVLSGGEMITPRVRELVFDPPSGDDFKFVAGQFVTLHLEHPEKLLRRSYSIATIPNGDPSIRVAVAEVEGGRATGILFTLQPGESVHASGPFGRFVLRDDNQPRYLLVATGTGVTPYRAFLPELERRLSEHSCTVELLLGVRRREELLYVDDFLTMTKKFPDTFRFHVAYSRKLPEDAQPWEHKGYVQSLLADLEADAMQDIAYLCGNPEMIDEAATYFASLEFPVANVRREKYISSN
ncbi:MAG: FAD-binding oxidoreductase [Gammaproteobacteria bacterium]